MDEKIIQLIIDLANQGGSLAVWLYTVHVLGGVLKYVIGFGIIYAAVNKIGSVIKTCIECKDER